MNRQAILFERALSLIMDEWGKTREEALAWLNDDTEDWTPRERHASTPLPDAFIQCTRTMTVDYESTILPAAEVEQAKVEYAKAVSDVRNGGALPLSSER